MSLQYDILWSIWLDNETNRKTYIKLALNSSWKLYTLQASLELMDIFNCCSKFIIDASCVFLLCSPNRSFYVDLSLRYYWSCTLIPFFFKLIFFPWLVFLRLMTHIFFVIIFNIHILFKLFHIEITTFSIFLLSYLFLNLFLCLLFSLDFHIHSFLVFVCGCARITYDLLSTNLFCTSLLVKLFYNFFIINLRRFLHLPQELHFLWRLFLACGINLHGLTRLFFFVLLLGVHMLVLWHFYPD